MKLPATIPRRIWGAGVVLLLLAGLLSSLLQAEVPLVYTRSSYGVTPFGWGAAYDLLSELKLGASRTREPITRRPAFSTQWLIEPAWHERERPHELARLEQFAHRGGTVVLIGADEEVWRALGLRRVVQTKSDAEASAAGGPDRRSQLFTPPEASELTGSLLPRTRSVELPPHVLFAPDNPGFVVRTQAGDGAFVLERTLGQGKLVAVATADFLTNERLASADNAQLVVDLQRAFGSPTFDERCHGFMPDRSLWSALGPRFLLLSGLSLLLLTIASLARLRRWPLPMPAKEELPPPTLEVFVGALAALYRARGKAEPQAVFRAYRAGYMHRLQRLLFGQRDVSEAQLAERVQRAVSLRTEDGRWLRHDVLPTSRAELKQAVLALERYAAASQTRRR